MSWINKKSLQRLSTDAETFLSKTFAIFTGKETHMCIFCAAIPATAAVGAKLGADQLQKPEEERRPIGRMTGIAVACLVVASIVYHTLIWRN
jgi:hypothetical protein